MARTAHSHEHRAVVAGALARKSSGEAAAGWPVRIDSHYVTSTATPQLEKQKSSLGSTQTVGPRPPASAGKARRPGAKQPFRLCLLQRA